MAIFKYVCADAYGNEYETEVAFYDCGNLSFKDLWVYGVEQAWTSSVVQLIREKHNLSGYLTLVGVECIAH